MSNNSDDTLLVNCDNSKTCTLCHSNNCNGHSLNSNFSSRKCMNCDSKNDSKCIKELDPNYSKVCKNDDDQCFTHIGTFIITRGCLSDQSSDFMEICQNDAEKCSICDENNCNNDNIVLETCINCDSTNDEKCQQKLDPYKGKICSTLNSNDALGCFLLMVSALKSLFAFILNNMFYSHSRYPNYGGVVFETWIQN